MNEAVLTVYGEPVGKARPRFDPRSKRTYTPSNTVSYEQMIKQNYALHYPGMVSADGMIKLRIVAYYGIPQSTSKKKRAKMLDHALRPMKKPDWDNVGKIVSDALNGVAYTDDKQVVDAHVLRFYSEQPRLEIKITEIPEL